MTVCNNCFRNMNMYNVQYCSVECRKGETPRGSGVDLDVNTMKQPPIEANVGLTRPYGNKEVINA